jgi:hypothetical protein
VRTANRLRAWLLVAAVVSTAAVCPVAAEITAQEQAAIDHLLDFIGQSECRFNRNGRSYDSDRALRHVMRKYDYFRGEIESAEDFIELAATRSTRSGEPYHFECDGQSVESAIVLGAELTRFRAQSGRR